MAPTSAEQHSISHLRESVAEADAATQETFRIMVANEPDAACERFLKAREWSVPKATKMLHDCLAWRLKNEVDDILAKPVVGAKYESIRASQLYGMSGFDNEGRPVLVVRVGLSFQEPDIKIEEYLHSHIQHNEYRDRILLPEISSKLGRPVTKCVKLYDMTGLKLSQLAKMKMQKAMAGVDDLNYPEKAEVYFVLNAPSVFNAAWKAVKNMLQERTKKKVQVLPGSGKEDLLKNMSEDCVPFFIQRAPLQGWGSSRSLDSAVSMREDDTMVDCCSSRHEYHVKMQNFMLALRQGLKAKGIARDDSTKAIREIALDVKEGDGVSSDLEAVMETAIKKAMESKEQRDGR